MNCPKCNKEVSPEWKLCPFCGFEPKRCSNPNHAPRWLKQEAKFCPDCGKKLDDTNSEHVLTQKRILPQNNNSSNHDELATAKKQFENYDFNTPFPTLLKYAQLGDAEAQYYVSLYYQFNFSIIRNPVERDEESSKWLRKSAEQNFAKAQFEMALRFVEKRVREEDENDKYSDEIELWFEKAEKYGFDLDSTIKWYRTAAHHGFAFAQYKLVVLLLGAVEDDSPEIEKEVVKWWRKAAEQGFAEAQYLLGKYLYDEVDEKEAVKWFFKAAEQGLVEAQTQLGDCYYDGDGVVEDEEEAVKWYRKAAEQGYAKAQYELGECYYYGFGEDEDEDEEEAEKWYRKAAAQGYEPAIEALNENF